ncbi:MAG TPA: HNH endonuclease [Bacteroidetes bacterium]|nr:HNH endonuclease [Bacteroidota bacterium]
MSRSIISQDTRSFVALRANHLCEYCLSFEGFSAVKFQIEHIISIKHGGTDDLLNLALACIFCNRFKGSDVGTILRAFQFTRFYHPRIDKWTDHFFLSDVLIEPKTEIGEATVKIFKLNDPDRLIERYAYLSKGYFPHPNTFLNIFPK